MPDYRRKVRRDPETTSVPSTIRKPRTTAIIIVEGPSSAVFKPKCFRVVLFRDSI